MSYSVSAKQIDIEAIEANAQRVCYLVDGHLEFTGTELYEIESKLMDSAPSKYKLQRQIDGHWVDATRYSKAFNTARLFLDLTQADFSKPLQFLIPEVIAAAQADPNRMHLALRQILRRLHDQVSADPRAVLVHKVRQFFDLLSNDLRDNHFDFFMTTLELLEESLNAGIVPAVDGVDTGQLELIQRTLDGFAVNYSTTGQKIAALNFFGKIASMIDRNSAAEHFAQLKEIDTQGIISDFYIDTGAWTYYSRADVSKPITSARSAEIRESIQPISASNTGNELGVLVSVDAGFFRMYGPSLYSYAQLLPQVDFNFLICGTEEEARELMNDGERFVNGLAALNKSGMPRNLGFYHVPVPGFAVQIRTFYSCARFYAVHMMLENYPRAYLMDADLFLEDDPTSFFERIKDLPFAAPVNTGLTHLSPWRRYLAGNIPFNREILDGNFISDIQDYVSCGLPSASSWMLDQNAIAFAIEQNFPGEDISLNRFNRPFRQPQFRKVIEKTYQAAIRG